MIGLWPRSLLGQITLAIAVTLFLVQGVNGYLAWTGERERAQTALVTTLGLRLIAMDLLVRPDEEMLSDLQNVGEGRALARGGGDRRGPRGPREARRAFAGTDFRRSGEFPVLEGDLRLPALETRLAETLRNNGREFDELRVIERNVAADIPAQRLIARMAVRRGWDDSDRPAKIALAGVRSGADWDIVRAPVYQPRDRLGILSPLLRAAALTALLALVLWLVVRRITGPLAQLTRRTEAFSASAAAAPMTPRGPEDVRRLIAAHNRMEKRIAALLDEKDVMLGAIGHDLKTPLAALRVRVENVEDEFARGRMVDSIEDIARTLDEILLLARIGRSDRPLERTDLFALLVSVVEEFEDMQEPVALLSGTRLAAPIHLTWLKRGVRNLVSNALRYGGTAEITLAREGGEAVIAIEDDGPGIPEDRIAEMLEPFARGEASRNRATGGAGLGLTIARAVAEQHGGRLILANRPQGGLRAQLRLPL